MEWIEKYSDFDELQKSSLALFCKENTYAQLLKETLFSLLILPCMRIMRMQNLSN
jgi:hypothetical protein